MSVGAKVIFTKLNTAERGLRIEHFKMNLTFGNKRTSGVAVGGRRGCEMRTGIFMRDIKNVPNS